MNYCELLSSDKSDMWFSIKDRMSDFRFPKLSGQDTVRRTDRGGCWTCIGTTRIDEAIFVVIRIFILSMLCPQLYKYYP